jgi:hypothetical protein
MEPTLEQMARLLAESGEYRVTSRLEPHAEYHPSDSSLKLIAAVVDVETTGTNADLASIIELGICLFEHDRQSGRIYKVLGSWEWLEDKCDGTESGRLDVADHSQKSVLGSVLVLGRANCLVLQKDSLRWRLG